MIPLLKEFPAIDTVGLDERKRAALECVLDAWNDALEIGIEPEVIASAAIYAALTDLVGSLGEESVAQIAASLSDRIKFGEFSVDRTIQ